MANPRSAKSSSARRREVRKKRPDRVPAWLAKLRRRDVTWAMLFTLLLALGGGAIAITARSGTQYHRNQVVTEPVVARVTFNAVNEELTRREKEAARASVTEVYRANSRALENLREELLGLLGIAEQKFDEIDPQMVEAVSLTAEGHAALVDFQQSEQDGSAGQRWQQRVDLMLRTFFAVPILSEADYDAAVARGGLITVIHPLPEPTQPAESNVFFSALLNVEDHTAVYERVEQVSSRMPDALQSTVMNMLLADVQPTYFYDDETTAARKFVAFDSTPDVYDSYMPGDLLVPAETRIDDQYFQLLQREAQAFRSQESWTRFLIARSGLVGTLLMLSAAVWLYVLRSGSRVPHNPVRGLAVTTLLLGGQALAVIGAGMSPSMPFGGVTFPTLLVTIVLAVVYSQPFALVLGAAHALIVTVTLDKPVGFALVLLAGVSIAVWQLREVRSRSKLVVVGAVTGLVMAGTLTVVWLIDHPAMTLEQWRRLGIDAAAAAASGFAAGLLVQGMLPLIERAFKVTTAMTLKELNDNARPLLKRLAHEAPGTYQHSLRIADMAEAAADAIGCDGLLCRVGAMYHDIGKINKPQYFIENQGGGPNKHRKLSPAMSLLVIVGHVKDGVEMAREYGLPRVLIHFIESHHGTTLVEYFYHAAKKKQEEKQLEAGQAEPDGEGPSEFEFRYPGPKPQSREAAIMLICDGIEAAARACDEPTPARLQQITHSIAMKRLLDGQFDECSLTLADLAKVESAIVKTLCAIYHSRIKYPAGERPERADRGAAATA